MDREKLLEALIIMAGADGSVARGEIELLARRCAQWGIAEERFGAMLSRCLDQEVDLDLPADLESRRAMLRQLVRMMGADGHLAIEEKKLFAAAAAAMDISDREVDELIDEVMQDPLG
ncbi:MAG: hypothetical protein KDA60_00960 [Planctomycetales bacterium]|nr:hypothetical protein [Planctomycetales bacterium]